MANTLKAYRPIPDDMLKVEWVCQACYTSWFTAPGAEAPECDCDSDVDCKYEATRVDVERLKLHLQDQEQRLRARDKGVG